MITVSPLTVTTRDILAETVTVSVDDSTPIYVLLMQWQQLEAQRNWLSNSFERNSLLNNETIFVNHDTFGLNLIIL